MLKKVLSLVLLMLFTFSVCPVNAVIDGEYRVRNSQVKDYSSKGENPYESEPTEQQIKARQEAYKLYTSKQGTTSINMVPLFDDWTTREAMAKINNMGTKILLANDINNFVRFEISKKETVNASTSYHDVITVYKNLLMYVETEDELAYVLSHEIAHAYKNDVRTRVIRRGIAAGTIISGVIIVASVGGKAGKRAGKGLILAGAGGGLLDQKLGKGQEKRADLNGIDFMVKAGYNPLAAISFMNKIMDRRWDILSSHPSGDKRLVFAYNYIAQNYPLYLEGGYDTISYKRAIEYLQSEKSDKINPSIKSNGKKTKKTKKIKKEEI